MSDNPPHKRSQFREMALGLTNYLKNSTVLLKTLEQNCEVAPGEILHSKRVEKI